MTQHIRSAFRFSPGHLAITGILALLGLSSAVVAFGGLFESRTSRTTLPPRTGVHVSHGYGTGESARTSDIDGLISKQDAERERVASTRNVMPPTRGSFMAVWADVNGASGYRLDVSTDGSFTSYVPGYRDLDV